MKDWKNNVVVLAAVMIVLTLINIIATYGLIQYNNVKLYGSYENFKKASLMNDFQFWALGKYEDLVKQVEEAKKAQWWNSDLPDNSASKEVEARVLSKEDLVYHTPVYGKENTKYSLYDFTDLECPYCKNFHNSGAAKEVVDRNPENLNHIVRNFPLESIHPGARLKAETSLCVAEIDWDKKYKEVVDAMFNEIHATSKDGILSKLEEKGYDKAKLEECLNSEKYSSKVSSDLALGEKMWVTWTPTVFVVNNETGEYKRVKSRSSEAIEEIMKSF